MGKADFTINEGSARETTETGSFVSKSSTKSCQDFVKDESFILTRHKRGEENIRTGTSQRWCGLLWLSLALAGSIFGCYIMWATDVFTLVIHQNLAIINNSMRYEAWKSPPVEALLRIYIFNYTNVQEFERGIDPKLKVEELGPYTYLEKLERVDVRFNKNGTATYRDKKTYRFSPEHSKGNESDIITVPNLPFLAALSFVKDMSPFLRWPVLHFLNSMSGQSFIPLSVGEFLWGYEDRLSVLAQKLVAFRYGLPFQKFGLLSAKNQTQKDLVTIYTGEEDPSKMGIVVNYDGRTSLDYWSSAECNRIDGTDGTVYPPSLVHPNSTLYVYSKDFCRKLPLVYSGKYSDKHGIPVLRFHLPENIFASGYSYKENLCFCSHQSDDDVKCLPSGIFNVAPCAFKIPIVTSLPHFLYGDPVLMKGIEGLQAEQRKHESYVEIEEKMGIPVGGKSRFQLNIMVDKEFGSYMKKVIYKNQFVFPFAWMDYGVDRLPDDISAMLRSLLSFIKAAEFILSYGFIVSVLTLLVYLITGCRQMVRNGYYNRNIKSGGKAPCIIVDQKR